MPPSRDIVSSFKAIMAYFTHRLQGNLADRQRNAFQLGAGALRDGLLMSVMSTLRWAAPCLLMVYKALLPS